MCLNFVACFSHFAIMVDHYIHKHKVSSEGGLPEYFL